MSPNEENGKMRLSDLAEARLTKYIEDSLLDRASGEHISIRTLILDDDGKILDEYHDYPELHEKDVCEAIRRTGSKLVCQISQVFYSKPDESGNIVQPRFAEDKRHAVMLAVFTPSHCFVEIFPFTIKADGRTVFISDPGVPKKREDVKSIWQKKYFGPDDINGAFRHDTVRLDLNGFDIDSIEAINERLNEYLVYIRRQCKANVRVFVFKGHELLGWKDSESLGQAVDVICNMLAKGGTAILWVGPTLINGDNYLHVIAATANAGTAFMIPVLNDEDGLRFGAVEELQDGKHQADGLRMMFRQKKNGIDG